MKKILHLVSTLTLCILLLACGNPNQRLDEYVFYDGPQFRLKVVRFYRNIPFDKLGEHAVVMCQSENTAEFPAPDPEDAGWRILGSEDVQGSNTAKEAALGVKDDYEVLDDHTLIGKMKVFNISFDACGHFVNWDPSRLPQAMLNPREKPDSCAPNGPADCRYYDFEDDRTPHYEQIRVAGKGRVSFTVSSPTFRGVERLGVQTRNNGDVWHVETAGADRQGPEVDVIRSLSMSLLESGMEDISLLDWLESVLPPGSIVIWPDVPVPCGDRRCAEIRFNDIEGNSGALYIAMNMDAENGPGKVSFHSAVYGSGNESRTVKSLTDLLNILSRDTE